MLDEAGSTTNSLRRVSGDVAGSSRVFVNDRGSQRPVDRSPELQLVCSGTKPTKRIGESAVNVAVALEVYPAVDDSEQDRFVDDLARRSDGDMIEQDADIIRMEPDAAVRLVMVNARRRIGPVNTDAG
jgi:hypothetical protein